MKKVVLLLLLTLSGWLYAQKPTSVSAVIKGYNGKVVDFEFMNQDDINKQFPYREGQEMSFETELEDINLMKVNSWIWICLRPGDQLHADIQYEGRNYKTAEFSGTPETVAANTAIRDMWNLRIANGYKMNIRAAIVTLVPMKEYYEATKRELEKELDILKSRKAKIPEDMYQYLYAEHEALLLTNLITCPEMYAGTGKVEQGTYPEDYWTILDNYQLHKDKDALKSRAYMVFLLTYKHYMRQKAAHDQGVAYQPNTTMKAEYEDIASFYEGGLRENALFVFLYNQIVAGRDFNELEPLVNHFLKKYNKSKYFKKVLGTIMQ